MTWAIGTDAISPKTSSSHFAYRLLRGSDWGRRADLKTEGRGKEAVVQASRTRLNFRMYPQASSGVFVLADALNPLRREKFYRNPPESASDLPSVLIALLCLNSSQIPYKRNHEKDVELPQTEYPT